MKKILDKKLALASETVRELTTGELGHAAGGLMMFYSGAVTGTAPCHAPSIRPAATAPCLMQSVAAAVTAPCKITITL